MGEVEGRDCSTTPHTQPKALPSNSSYKESAVKRKRGRDASKRKPSPSNSRTPLAAAGFARSVQGNKKRTSKYAGVSLHAGSQKWRIQIHVPDNAKSLVESFADEVAAARRYDAIVRHPPLHISFYDQPRPPSVFSPRHSPSFDAGARAQHPPAAAQPRPHRGGGRRWAR